VVGAGWEAVFVLNCATGPTVLRESYGFDGPALRATAAKLDVAVGPLCENWEAIHGDH
jgi:hypothetical protein